MKVVAIALQLSSSREDAHRAVTLDPALRSVILKSLYARSGVAHALVVAISLMRFKVKHSK